MTLTPKFKVTKCSGGGGGGGPVFV
jgi:hypothetical protein